MDRFFADVDAGRSFAGRGGLIGEVLDFVASEGFGPTAQRQGQNWDNARQFRDRYVMAAIKGLGQ